VHRVPFDVEGPAAAAEFARGGGFAPLRSAGFRYKKDKSEIDNEFDFFAFFWLIWQRFGLTLAAGPDCRVFSASLVWESESG
jgi:hypothetical protein